MKYFRYLASQINANKKFFEHYMNFPAKNMRQSSVAMIFKINNQKHNWKNYKQKIQSYYSNKSHNYDFNSVVSDQLLTQILQKIDDSEIQLLFVQRAINPKDINSANIALPGGKCQNNETDLMACLRQTQQQTGLILQTKNQKNETTYLNLYIGKLNKNFFYRYHKGQNLYISCHVFLILESRITIILNTQQLAEARWVPFSRLLKLQYLKFCQEQKHISLQKILFEKPQFLKNSIKKNLLYVEYPQLNLNMQKNLWGLTFYIWLHAVKIINFKLEGKKELELFIKESQKFKIKFNWYYIPGYFIKYFGQRWNYKNRIQNFQYKQKSKSKIKTLSTTSFIIVAILLCSTIIVFLF